jgi:hypothetical protein
MMSIRMSIIVMVGVVAAQAAATPGSQRVSEALLKAADLDPMPFVMMLAQAGIPAGLEVRASDEIPRGKPNLQFTNNQMVTLIEVVAAFNSRHIGYRAELREGVFVIRPVQNRAAYLDRPSSIGHVTVSGPMSAAGKIFAPLNPTLNGTGGTLGSSINVAGTQMGENTLIDINGHGRTNEQLLNEVVRQSPRAWIVTTNGDAEARVVKVGFMHPGGAATFVDVDATRN